MVATRIQLDHSRPCLACGAPWRVLSQARITGKPANVPAVWSELDGTCSARCWEQDPDRYVAALAERARLGWEPAPTSDADGAG